MREIWGESAKFHTTSQRMDDQARLILKKGWFSDLEKRKICEQIIREEYAEQDPSKRAETHTIENENIT